VAVTDPRGHHLGWWLAPAAIGLVVAGWSMVVMQEHLHGVLFAAGLVVAGLDLMLVGGWLHRRATAVDADAGMIVAPGRTPRVRNAAVGGRRSTITSGDGRGWASGWPRPASCCCCWP
jgi:hypothetical protein